ncbi:MAG: 3-oxoacyl-[acyl-carrier-protein] reductase [Candidatus Gastranaerophilales bacterium]|nr:3-oxoacyl-[acyl-carrier-protein] reductase [Candidatus Gastranaerophilales bacterium]
MNQESKVAIVTGASRGIGKACAIELAKTGYTVIINYASNDDAANAVVKSITDNGGQAKAIKCDVSDSVSVKCMIDTVMNEFKRIDVLVNNAGITKDGLFIRMSDEDWLKVINTNLNSVFYVTKPVVKIMMKQRIGTIINISSICGVYGNAGQANYSSAKAGIIGFTKSLAKEIAARNITVNAIAPGFIETDMTSGLETEKIVANIPLGRLGKPEDIAQTVKFLVTSGSYITGQVIGVDGGLVI